MISLVKSWLAKSNKETKDKLETRVGIDIKNKSSEKRELIYSEDSSSSKKVKFEEKIKVKDLPDIVDDSGDKNEVAQNYIKLTRTKHELASVQQELEELQSSVRSPLICVVCDQLPRTIPVLQCSNHHTTCRSCSQTDCNLCSRPLCPYSSPLHTAVLASLSRQCIHGCTVKDNLEQILEHETKCCQQPVLCWGCGSRPPLNTFSTHDPDLACFSFRRVHEAPVSKILLNSVNKFEGKFPLKYTENVSWNPLAIRFAGQMFYLRVERVHNRGDWVFYVAAQLLRDNCSKYVVSVSVTSPTLPDPDLRRKWMFSGPPSSLAIKLENVLNQGQCLVLSDPAMEQIMSISPDMSGSTFKVTVDLQKLS